MTPVRRAPRVGLGLLALLALAAAEPVRAQVDAAKASPSAPKAGYTIGASDVLQIMVWKEPDLTRDVTVRIDG